MCSRPSNPSRNPPHARQDHPDRRKLRRHVRLLPRGAGGRRQGAGRGARLGGPRGRYRHQGARATSSPATAISPPRRTCSPGRCRARCPPSDPRAAERAQPRLERIKTGEADMADTLAEIRKLPQHNGRAAAMGFCFGGPYAILGPKRLGYDAGISCHGTQMLDFIGELDGVTAPICIVWGDQDHAAPAAGARCLPRRPRPPSERRGPHLPGRPPRLHDAVEHQGVLGADPGVRDGARRSPSSARCATVRRCAARPEAMRGCRG